MTAKAVFLLCAQAFLAQLISSQYIGAGYNGIGADGLAWGPAAPWNAALPYAVETPLATWAAAPCAATPFATAEWATGFGPASLTASNGGGLPINSASPYPITGVSMTSENVYEGQLAVAGAMPFLGGVALEGLVPTVGGGAVNYGCGNGNVAMLSEDVGAAFPGYTGAYGYGPGFAAAELGYGANLGYEADIVGAAYGYGYNRGCGALY